MRLWILSHLEGSPGNRLVEAAARSAGHDVELVHPDRLSPLVAGRTPSLRGAEGTVEPPDVVFTRIGSSAPLSALDTLRHLEAMRVPCINASRSLELARDKLRTFQELSRAGLPLPPTLAVGRRTRLQEVPEELGGPPWIVKLPAGTQGMGVARIDSLESLRSTLDMLAQLGQRVLLQRFVEEAKGSDVRVLVIDGRARAAMRRTAPLGQVRANLHQGGSGELVELTGELAKLSELAAGTLGLDVSGVDLLESRDGPVVLEVNGSPGLEGIARVTGLDLAGDIVRFLAQRTSP